MANSVIEKHGHLWADNFSATRHAYLHRVQSALSQKMNKNLQYKCATQPSRYEKSNAGYKKLFQQFSQFGFKVFTAQIFCDDCSGRIY